MSGLRLGLAFGAMLLVSGCGAVYHKNASEYLQAQPLSAWGELPENYKEIVESRIKALLKDPDSAVFQHLRAERAVMPLTVGSPQVAPVWAIDVLVNAKNSFGGYTGNKPYTVYMHKDGRLFLYEGRSTVEKRVGQ